MVESADEPPLSNNSHTWAKNNISSVLNPFRAGRKDPDSNRTDILPQYVSNNPISAAGPATTEPNEEHKDNLQQNPSVVDKKGDGEKSTTIGNTVPKASLVSRFFRDVNRIIRSSWINWLLVFVPIGIILGILVDWAHSEVVSPSVVFAINAVAIIPLASLLSFATESVASKLGDTIGALLNVTFGNAVELIIFIIALAAKEVRVVQAAALGSILSNLLLILGMCFVAGGLRFREQLYNSTVSQMSACLLCLSVISLLLPTAFHASFGNVAEADNLVLKVSRGTSVVLLLVYILYLLFQLKSHSFMYASTPQHLIDEESHPGVLAEILNSSSSSSEASDSSGSDSDSSNGSHTTAKRIRRALRRKRRKSMSSSKENASPPFVRTPSLGTNAHFSTHPNGTSQSLSRPSPDLDAVFSGDEADLDGEGRRRHRRRSQAPSTIQSRDFEPSHIGLSEGEEKGRKKSKKHKKSKRSKKMQDKEKSVALTNEVTETGSITLPPPQVTFATQVQEAVEDTSSKRPLNIRHISEAVRPAFSSTVFPHHQAVGRQLAVPISVVRPNVTSSPMTRPIRRTSSMPDIGSNNPRSDQANINVPAPHVIQEVPLTTEADSEDVFETQKLLSRTSAVILLLVSTGLVALCAEFLVGSINYLVANSSVSQTFIGLIILPIVGNAAEHVTAVTVAAKNKMDLAINIALGSSIQIALFVTPLMVILGWIIKTDMSLYFSLFETVSLFASAFIVSFLMIDGRSNYLEGALLIAAYVIIAVAAFFYPTCGLNALSGPEGGSTC